MRSKKQKNIDGYSESVWSSLDVKSLRIGWVEGLQAAAKRLPSGTVKNLLTTGIFEDLFPGSCDELSEEVLQIERDDYEALCAHETHHNRGYTEAFCNLADEACSPYGQRQALLIMEDYVSRRTRLKWLAPMAFNCLYTWYKIKPCDSGVSRTPLHQEFTGMPACIIDGHTYEGKLNGKNCLLLSGHYENHRRLGRAIYGHGGWGVVREVFSKERIYPVEGLNEVKITEQCLF